MPTSGSEEVSYFYRFLLIAGIIGLNGFLAGAEVALLSSRRPKLLAMGEAGDNGAKAALHLLDRPERLLSVIQFGVTLLSLILGSVGEETFHKILMSIAGPFISVATIGMLDKVAYFGAFILMAFPHVVLGEVVPKNIGLERAERLAALSAPILLFLSKICGPFVVVIEKAAAYLSKLAGVQGASHAGGHSVEELKFIISSVKTQGHLREFEEEAMHRLLELKKLTARQIMIPRNQFVSVPEDATLNYVMSVINEHQFSRLLVYEESPEHIVGIVHLKDLVRVWIERRAAHDARKPMAPFRLKQIIRKPLEVPETKNLSELINEFRANIGHLALIVDEFGSVTGLVTLEDVLEQVFGEIEDEHDVTRPKVLEEGVLTIPGTITIRDLAVRHNIELPSDAGFETLAGFLMFNLGYIPEPGESLEHSGHRFVVLEMDRNRIARVRVEALARAEKGMIPGA